MVFQTTLLILQSPIHSFWSQSDRWLYCVMTFNQKRLITIINLIATLGIIYTSLHNRGLSWVSVVTDVTTAVPLWALCASCGRSWSPPTPLCKPRTFILSSLQHDNLRSTCIFVRRPSHLELTTWKYAEINIHGHLQMLSKDIFIRADYAFSALGTIFV